MGYLDYTGLQYLWGKLKEKFAPKSHSHDDRYYTESEMDGKLNSKVNNNEAGANGLLSKLTTSWTAAPTDDTYFIRQDIGGGNQFGRVKFSTIWNYIKGKTDGIYQPKGSYAASGHTHDDRYYTESEMNTKLAGKSNIDHTHDTSSISAGNANYAGWAGPIESAHIDVLRANRLAFLPASGVKVEYSVDGGTTWVDYGATDTQKASLFAMRMGSAAPFYTGKHTKADECTTKDQLRITITPVDRYASVNMLYLWVSVAGTSATVNISRSTIGAKETFTDVRTDVPISGWSGPNEIRFSGGTFGGGSTQTSNAYAYRFTFKNKADGKGSVRVMDIRMYGPSAWGVPNNMMEKDHIYNWDANQNVQFPAQVTATKFNGSSTGVVDYGDSNGSTIKVGYNGAGLTKDKLTHIAGYAKDGNQTVIKDVDRGVLQSWLNLNEMINTQLTTGFTTPSDNDFYISQYAGGGATTTTYHRRPISALWNYIKSKADAVYSAKSHTHTKSQITDFPASLKNPTALTIQTNGATAAIYDGSAAKTVNVTKGNIGLGNVDNTADANKSVKYATSAGSASTATKATTADSANALSGLSSRSSQGWGVQTGTFIHGENDSTGGSMAFRRDCPNGGQMSMVIDGRFYQNEGQYRVLDTSDEPNLNVRSANFAKETYINQYKTVNLTSFDQNTWYPVTGASIPYNGLRRFKCNVQLNSGSKPSWSTHGRGFTAVVDILEEASGWGTTSMQGIVLINNQCFINDLNKPPVGYGQMGNSSTPVWWLRGGGTYFLAADYDCTWTIQKSKYESSGQSVEPRTTYPGVYVNRATITANLNGNATTAEIATVGVRDYNNSNNTIKIGWSGADLDAKTLSYVAGYTSDMKIHTASKDGVRSWLGLGNAAYKKIQSLSAVGHSDWKNQSTGDGFVPTMAFMAFWNGAFNGSGNSNLQYCDHGRFGTIVTKNSGDYAAAGHTHSFSSITGKPSTYPPSTHNQSWDTITGKPALMESDGYHAETIEALLKQIQGLSPRMGSCSFTKDTHVANTWWNFIYIPHRTGSGDDNPDYGTLLLFPMVGAGSSYIIRAGKDGIVREVRKIYTSGDKPTKGDVGLGNVDNTADANKSVASAAGIKDAGDDRTLTLAYSKDGLAYKSYSWLAGWNGNELRAVDKNQFATAEHGITASGSNYVRFGSGTQICWGITNCQGKEVTASFAVAFNNTNYAVTIMGDYASWADTYWITGNHITTSFAIKASGGSAASRPINWIAIGTWK